MTLVEAVAALDSLDEESTIYASRPWGSDSDVIVAHEPDSGGLPLDAQRLGLTYFLEVFIARQFLEGWMANVRQSRRCKTELLGLSNTR